MWYPVNPYAVDAKPSPEQLASPLSMTGNYSWLHYLVWARRRLNLEDLPELPDDDKMALITKKLGPRPEDFTMWNLFKTVKFNQGVCFACDSASCMSAFVAPLSLQILLRALQGRSSYTPWLFVIGIALRPALDGVLEHNALFSSNR